MAKTISEDQAFWFCSSNGWVGQIAHSLEEFSEHIKNVPIECLEFHLREDKNDFEAWMSSVLSKKRLSKKLVLLKMQGLKGEELRKGLVKLFEKAEKPAQQSEPTA
jgi:hypothetical protein